MFQIFLTLLPYSNKVIRLQGERDCDSTKVKQIKKNKVSKNQVYDVPAPQKDLAIFPAKSFFDLLENLCLEKITDRKSTRLNSSHSS